MNNTGLLVDIFDNNVNIMIDLDTLKTSMEYGLQFVELGIITDKEAFMKDVIRELIYEEEDGTNLIHKMFDKAAERAIDNGSEYWEEYTDI